jgi:transcriptional regulator with XRE-family HTH domain
MLRIARLLRGESLYTVAVAIGSTKGHLSELERSNGRHTSRPLQAKLVKHFGGSCDFATLVKSIDGHKLAGSILAAAARQTETHDAK